MDEHLGSFLEKFAEIERRLRKNSVCDRSIREELDSLRNKLAEAEAEIEWLRESLKKQDQLRKKAGKKVDALLEWLEGSGAASQDQASSLAEVKPGER